MRALALALVFATLATCALAGNSTLIMNPVTVPGHSACPQGLGTPNDGCANAPAPLTAAFRHLTAFQSGSYFNTVAGTTANYSTTRPPWNVAGVDYNIGYYTPLASLLDPATSAPAGCVFSTTASGTGGNLLTCSGASFAGVIQHMNFGPVGGHGCTALLIETGSPSSTLLIDDFNFKNDTGLCSINSSFPDAILIFGASFPGGITISNYVMDGNSSTFDNPYGGCASGTQCNPSQAYDLGPNPITDLYGVIEHFAGRPVQGGVGTIASYTKQFGWVEDWDTRGPNGHTEWFVGATGSAGIRNLIFDYNVELQAQNVIQFGPDPIFAADNYPMPIDNQKIDNNVIIDSFIGGGTKTATTSGCIGATYSGGCSGSGSTYFATSITGTIGYGENLNCGSPNVVLYKAIAGPYPSGVVGEWTVDGQGGGSTQYAPPTGTFAVGPETCTTVSMVAAVANIAIWGTDANTPLGTSEFLNNYVDVTSQSGSVGSQNIWTMGQVFGNTPVTGSIATSGGTSTLTTTSSITPKIGSFVVASNITGCGGTNLSCPQIVSGSGTSWVLSANVGVVGSESMTVEPLAWCTTPAVFSGNIDMTGLISSGSLNAWSNGIGSAIGC